MPEATELKRIGIGRYDIARSLGEGNDIPQDKPRPPSQIYGAISPLFDGIVVKALAKDVARRFQYAEALKYYQIVRENGVDPGVAKDR